MMTSRSRAFDMLQILSKSLIAQDESIIFCIIFLIRFRPTGQVSNVFLIVTTTTQGHDTDLDAALKLGAEEERVVRRLVGLGDERVGPVEAVAFNLRLHRPVVVRVVNLVTWQSNGLQVHTYTGHVQRQKMSILVTKSSMTMRRFRGGERE